MAIDVSVKLLHIVVDRKQETGREYHRREVREEKSFRINLWLNLVISTVKQLDLATNLVLRLNS